MRLLLLVFAAGALFAHDFWIEPSTFNPEPGRAVGIRLRVGQDLMGDPVARDPALLRQFVVEESGRRSDVAGRNGADPAGVLRVASPGLLVVGYLSNASAVELKAEQFERYLKEEGLDAVLAERARGKQSGEPVRELFARCAKSLLLAGAPDGRQRDRTLGFPLELTAERNPYVLAPGEDLPVRLTYGNLPLGGALVVAMNRLDPSQKQSARTGPDGRVRFRLRPGGMWLVKAVHMIPAPAGSGARWASYWASLTFAGPLPQSAGRAQGNAE
jgi:hypothetical protein